MDVSVDTNVLIHLYKAKSKKLLFSSFDKVYAYEYIIDTELSNNDKNINYSNYIIKRFYRLIVSTWIFLFIFFSTFFAKAIKALSPK